MKDALVLGSGYTGSRLARLLRSHDLEVIETSLRKPGVFQVDLDRPETWNAEKLRARICFWLAPTLGTKETQDFMSAIKNPFEKIILLSSAGFYRATHTDELVRRSSALEEGHPRVQSENFLLKEFQNVCVVHSAGIYGPKRNPVDWLIERRVARSPKYVNLVHVDDLAELLYLISQKPEISGRWLASDGQPMTWEQLYQAWRIEYHLPDMPLESEVKDSKRIDPSETMKYFNWNLKYPNVIEGVAHGMQEDSFEDSRNIKLNS